MLYYSKKFLAEHESEITLHKAAKKKFDELGVKKPPTDKSNCDRLLGMDEERDDPNATKEKGAEQR